MDGDIVEQTAQAIRDEIIRSPWRGHPAKTIFFGGGTPTFLTERQLLSIFEAVLEVHPPILDAEITSEANPGTVDQDKFQAMHKAGFNRISLGAQSFLDTDLVRLGRIHRSGEIERAVHAARSAGFDNLNLDLMFGLPGQSRHAWNSNLERALALSPEHLSLYCLTIEPNTAYYKLHLKGLLELPDDEEQVDMYDDCTSQTLNAGFHQYEISNYAKLGRECQHNLCYWYGEEYAGYGPGAVGAMDAEQGRIRYTNLKHPEHYVQAVRDKKPLPFESELLSHSTLRTERIMLGLRLNAGLKTEGLDLPTPIIRKLVERNWIENVGDRIRLTPSGRHFCTEVASELI